MAIQQEIRFLLAAEAGETFVAIPTILKIPLGEGQSIRKRFTIRGKQRGAGSIRSTHTMALTGVCLSCVKVELDFEEEKRKERKWKRKGKGNRKGKERKKERDVGGFCVIVYSFGDTNNLSCFKKKERKKERKRKRKGKEKGKGFW